MRLEAKDVCKRLDKLKSDRGIWETHWQELADYVLPRKNTFTRVLVSGEKKGITLYDNTAMVSCDLLASNLHGTLTNNSVQWFQLSAGKEELNQNENVVEYLQELTMRAHRVLNGSNFQSEVHEHYLDLCTFGTSVMTVEKDEKTKVRFSTKHLAEVFVAENSHGVIEEVYRCFKWEAHQIVQEFCQGLDPKDRDALEFKVGRKVVDSYFKNEKEKFEIIHCVYRENLTEDIPMPFISLYVLKDDEKELSTGRFRKFPYLVSRWTKVSGEEYGRSPAMNALPEAKTLNVMALTMIKGAQKVVDPPVQMPDDGFVRPLRTVPGGVNYYRAGSNDRVEPIFNDTRIDFGFEALRERQLRVQQAFYIDRLNLANNDRMTTVEVNQRIQEQMRFLGPVLGRQETEFLKRLIDLVLDIMIEEDAGTGEVIGIPPEELQDVDLDVHYSSPIARAQRIQEANSLNAALAASAPVLQLDMSAADVIDAEKVVKENWMIYGAPQRVLRKRREVEAIREARANAQQAAIEQEESMQTAEKLSKTAPLLKE